MPWSLEKSPSSPSPRAGPRGLPVGTVSPAAPHSGPPCFPASARSLRPYFSYERVILKPSLVSRVSPTTVAGPGLSPRTPQPPATTQAHVGPPPSQRFQVASRGPCAPSARPPRGRGLSCLAKTSPLDFLGHLQIPPVVEDARQPAARGPGAAPEIVAHPSRRA